MSLRPPCPKSASDLTNALVTELAEIFTATLKNLVEKLPRIVPNTAKNGRHLEWNGKHID